MHARSFSLTSGLKFVGIFLRSAVLTHGQFYVTVSRDTATSPTRGRVGDPNCLLIMVVNGHTDNGDIVVDGVRHVYTRNVVYP